MQSMAHAISSSSTWTESNLASGYVFAVLGALLPRWLLRCYGGFKADILAGAQLFRGH